MGAAFALEVLDKAPYVSVMDAAKKIMQHNIMKHGFTYCGISS